MARADGGEHVTAPRRMRGPASVPLARLARHRTARSVRRENPGAGLPKHGHGSLPASSCARPRRPSPLVLGLRLRAAPRAAPRLRAGRRRDAGVARGGRNAHGDEAGLGASPSHRRGRRLARARAHSPAGLGSAHAGAVPALRGPACSRARRARRRPPARVRRAPLRSCISQEGGEGATALVDHPLWASYLELGDVLLIDQRGTGRSQPSLSWSSPGIDAGLLFGERPPRWPRSSNGAGLRGPTSPRAGSSSRPSPPAPAPTTWPRCWTCWATRARACWPTATARTSPSTSCGAIPSASSAARSSVSPVRTTCSSRRASWSPSWPSSRAARRPTRESHVCCRTCRRRSTRCSRARARIPSGSRSAIRSPTPRASCRSAPSACSSILLFDLGDPSDLCVLPRLIHELTRGETGTLAWFAAKRDAPSRRLPLAFFALRGSSGVSPERRARIERDAKASRFEDVRNFPSPMCSRCSESARTRHSSRPS